MPDSWPEWPRLKPRPWYAILGIIPFILAKIFGWMAFACLLLASKLDPELEH